MTLTHVVPVVASSAGGPQVRGMMWGYVPWYERGKPQMRMLPNAKAETAATSPAFRKAVAERRCLVPANGFYEWRTEGNLKSPYLFTLRGEEPFAFAGFWEPGEEDLPPTFGILTTRPNSLVAPIHNRMPVLLTQGTMPQWIGEKPPAEDMYRQLTEPLAAERMESRPVNRFVNSSRNEGPKCLDPPDPEAPELTLGLDV